MKTSKKIILTILIMIIVVAICILAYLKSIKTNKSANEANNQVAEEISTEPIFTDEDCPKVDASSATQPLMTAMMSNFLGKELTDDDFDYTKTHSAYEKLINGDVDLIIVTEPSEEEEELAEENGVELEVVPVVKEGFVFYVNGKNPIESLTLEQIQQIYAGEITNWSEVGGNDEDIIAYQRPTNSGSQTGILSLVMKGKEMMNPANNVISTMEGIIKTVANYKDGQGSIGYSYYYYATAMYNLIEENSENGIKLLGVNGVKPTYDTIKDGSYPIQTNYYIVIKKSEEEGSNARKLMEAMLSTRGQNIAKEVGYVPVN